MQSFLRTNEKKMIGKGREVTAKRKNGSVFPIKLTVNEIKLHRQRERSFIGMMHDLTIYKAKDTKIHEQEARLRSIVELAVDGIITIDEHGVVESFNVAASNLFGYTEEEVLRQNVKMLMPSPYHEKHDTYRQKYKETGKRQTIGIGREVVGWRKDRSVFPVELSVSEVVVGKHRSFTGIVRDISDRKEFEEELLKSRDQALQSSQLKAEFLATVSHESKRELCIYI